MPFPNYPLATDKANSTPQTTDHPTHHNRLATAANDLQGQVDVLTAAVATKVAKAGDTMTGALTLPSSPTSTLHAATKGYTDNLRDEQVSSLRFVPAGPDDTTANPVALWLSPGDLIVPSWADMVDTVIVIAFARAVTAAFNGYWEPRLDGNTTTTTARRVEFPTADTPADLVAHIRWTGLTGGATLPFEVWAVRSSGGGALRVDANSRVEVVALWRHT